MSTTSKTTSRFPQAPRTTGAFGETARVADGVPPRVEVKHSTQGQAVNGAGVEEVRKRAYEIYMSRRLTGSPGSQETDWLQAERELRVRA